MIDLHLVDRRGFMGGAAAAAVPLLGGPCLLSADEEKPAPKLITRQMVREMKPGSVLCDVAIDQGGCAETSRPTTHSEPVYTVDGVIHYCVANMPGAVPVTATKALTNVTLPYVEAIADHGLAEAVARDRSLARGVNVLHGKVTYEAVAEAHGLDYAPLEDVLPLAPV